MSTNDNDNLDPVQTNRLASAKLREVLEELDNHIVALTAPTMELSLVRKKQASESGLEEKDPSFQTRQFVSGAGSPSSIGVAAPGGLNPDASTPTGMPNKEAWAEYLGKRVGGGNMPPSLMPEAGSPIRGRTNVEAETLEGKSIEIPQFGDWQVDSLFRLGAQFAGKNAIKKYRSDAGEQFDRGQVPQSPEEWQQEQGSFSISNTAGLLSKGASIAAIGSLIHKKIGAPLADIGFGATSVGASLGYSPAGGSMGPATFHGIPNPLAALGSEAGRQGLGMVVNSAEAAFGGTGIGFGEANAIRQALAQQGWSNQRAGGLFGSNGGEQETLATAFEPLLKKGFRNPEMLAEFTSSLKLGTGTIGELTEGIEKLSTTAKLTNQSLEVEMQRAQEYMAKVIEGGGTGVQGLRSHGEVAGITGMNPLLIQGINEGQFGQIQALGKGILPWEVQSLSGSESALNAYEAYKKVAGYVPPQTASKGRINKVTGKEEPGESAAQKRAAWIHKLEPSITAEMAERLATIGPTLEAVAGGLTQGRDIHSKQFSMEGHNEANSGAAAIYDGLLKQRELQEDYIQKLHENPHTRPRAIKSAEEKLRLTKDMAAQAAHGAMGAGKLNRGQRESLEGELKGPRGLYHTAEEAGLREPQLKAIKGESLEKQTGSIMAALEKLNQVNVEKEKEENAKIELSGEALRWFKLKFPNAKTPKQEANEGGKSTASAAANPSVPGETAANRAAQKAGEQAYRREPTGG